MPSVTTLSPLSMSDLRRILTDVRGSLISQYTALFGYSGIEIKFTSKALDEICHKAFQEEGAQEAFAALWCAFFHDWAIATVSHCRLGIAVTGTDV